MMVAVGGSGSIPLPLSLLPDPSDPGVRAGKSLGPALDDPAEDQARGENEFGKSGKR
jgi:hypothetical protein